MEYNNFSFLMDSEIIFGRDTENEAGRMVKKYGGTKVMVVYGSGSIIQNGLYDRVTDSLRKEGIKFRQFGGVKPNPLRSFAEQGVKAAMEDGVDFILGVGGGSVIDTAKAIAFGVANSGDFWQFYLGKVPEKTIPVGTIVTIAASGSETSRSGVIVDDVETGQKKGLWSLFRPAFAIMNPELTYTLPPYQTAAGCVDIFSHTFMRYFSNLPSYLADRLGEASMQTIVKYAPIALKEPENYDARAEILLTGSLSHSDLMFIGRLSSGKAGGEHALESQLSGFYNTTHGAGLAVLMPAMLSYFVLHGSEEHIARVAQFAVSVFDVPHDAGNATEKAKLGIARFSEWLRSLGMPSTLSELGIPAEEIPSAIDRCIQARGTTIDGFLPLSPSAVKEIYKSIS